MSTTTKIRLTGFGRLLALFNRLGWGSDCNGRKLICTPFDGHYGQAGWVLCLEGSPPRGTICFLGTKYDGWGLAIYTDGEKARKLPDKQAEIVRQFWSEELKGRNEVRTFGKGLGE